MCLAPPLLALDYFQFNKREWISISKGKYKQIIVNLYEKEKVVTCHPSTSSNGLFDFA